MIIQSIGKYVKWQEHSYIASGIVKLYSHFTLLVSTKFKQKLTLWHNNMTFSFKISEYRCLHKICIYEYS